MIFTIRLAIPLDVPSLTVLFNSDSNIFGEDNTGYEEKDIAEYISDKKKKLFICEYEGKIAGALMADYHDTYSHVETLIVDKSIQAHGVGSALLDHHEQDLEALGIKLIEGLTEVNNTTMQKILAKRGFKKGNTFVFYSKGR